MKVIWKRPDGFHGAAPADYTVIDVGGKSKIWLHKTDAKNFPFRISGGWQDEDATARLNRLVNLLNKEPREWVTHLKKAMDDSQAENASVFLRDTKDWLEQLKSKLKGDTWETTIMMEALSEVIHKIQAVEGEF